MDPITHGVIGMAISKLAGNEISISDAATASIVIGSVFPDIDIVFQKWGDYAYLKNHRGITHSIVGLMASSVFIAFLLSAFYTDANVYSLMFWALIGGFSHTFFDIFNSYGAKLLWPFSNRKFSLSLLIIFDPVFLASLVGYIYTSGMMQQGFIALFAIYLLSRIIMRTFVSRELKRRFGKTSKRISLLPSMTSLFRWHFVLEEPSCNIIGEKSILKRDIRIMERLNKIQDELLDKVLKSHVGQFFTEFTPIFHIMYEKVGGITRYILIDMRYYIRKDFLHHAVLEMDENDDIITASFNPYSINRVNTIPEPSVKPENSLFSRFVGL
ncbi:MAG: metal-dependent hydrolase [Bacillota bacterium]